MSPSRRRLVGMVGVGLVLLGALVWAFWPQPVPVDLAEVGRGPLVVTIDEEGETRVRDVYVVSAPVAGRALRIDAEVGDQVVAGETVVATIQESEPAFLDLRGRRQAEANVQAADAALALAEAEVARADAELEFAEQDLERAQALAGRQTISERTLDRAELAVKTERAALASARAQLRVRQSELETARAALIGPGLAAIADAGAVGCCFEIRAPVSGRILRVHHESEGVVGAGTPLVEIGDPFDLEVVVDLLSQDAVRVPPEARVLIEDWGGGEALEGRVRRVEPYGFTKTSALGIEEQRVDVIVDLLDPRAAGRALGHGYRVAARIVVWQANEVLQLPLGALFRQGDDWAVFVESAGRAELRTIELGQRARLMAEIRDGLAAGERVVMHPSDRVQAGTRVTSRTTTALR